MSILKVNTIQPFSGNSVKITGQSVISGSFSGSFEGAFDGTVEYVDITGKPTLISGSNQLAGKSIDGNLTVNSSLYILSSSHDYRQGINLAKGGVVVSTISTGSFTGAFFDYVITSGSNARAGTLMTAWNGANITYADTSTADIGNTGDVDIYTQINGSNVELVLTSLKAGWNLKSVSRLL